MSLLEGFSDTINKLGSIAIDIDKIHDNITGKNQTQQAQTQSNITPTKQNTPTQEPINSSNWLTKAQELTKTPLGIGILALISLGVFTALKKVFK